MRVDATPISTSESTSMRLRPIRSPRCPATIPPMGRARNPTPYAANDERRPTAGVWFGKNWLPNTSADAVA